MMEPGLYQYIPNADRLLLLVVNHGPSCGSRFRLDRDVEGLETYAGETYWVRLGDIMPWLWRRIL